MIPQYRAMYESLEKHHQECLDTTHPEFERRKLALLLKISSILLQPYREHKQKIMQESASSDQNHDAL